MRHVFKFKLVPELDHDEFVWEDGRITPEIWSAYVDSFAGEPMQTAAGGPSLPVDRADAASVRALLVEQMYEVQVEPMPAGPEVELPDGAIP